MKAHQVAAKTTESFDIPEQKCCQCLRPLQAPWGRIAGGKWVCSSNCNKLYQLEKQGITNNMATVRRLTD